MIRRRIPPSGSGETIAAPPPSAEAHDDSAAAGPAAWSPATRAIFRFGVLYLGLFTLATQFSGSLLPNLSFYYRGLGRLPPMRDITLWIGERVAGAPVPIEEATSGGEPLLR